MRTASRGLRRIFAPFLASTMLVLSVAVPTLDAGRSATSPVFESHHARGECVAGHDHTLCAQVGATRALPSAHVRLPFPTLRLSSAAGLPEAALHERVADTGYASRAPPVA